MADGAAAAAAGAGGAPEFERVILVTGGAGFIASHVVMRLVKNYPTYKIVNFDKLDYCSSLKNLESIEDMPNYTFVKGSITSSDLVNFVLKSEGVDTIMHFAAQTHVDNSFGNSFTFTENNIMGTHTLLEAAKVMKDQIRLFIHVSTDEVYGHGKEGVASHEQSPIEPTNPYAATKAGAEYLVKAYRRSFGLPTIITRGNNVYGPHQFPEKIIPKFVNQIMRGKSLTLHGTGENTRNYLFVEDVAEAFDVILHKGTIGEIYNIGGDNEKSNMEVAEAILTGMGCVEREGSLAEAKAKHLILVPDRPFNDLRYPLDCTRLAELGWVERTSWEDGMRRTIDWYKKYSDNWENVESALVAHPRRGLLPGQLNLEHTKPHTAVAAAAAPAAAPAAAE